MSRPLFTTTQARFFVNHIHGKPHAALASLMNERFNLNITPRQIASYIKNHKLNTGRTGRFEKGNRPHNAGARGLGLHKSGEKTQFKPGNKPLNWKPVGSERVNVEGYVEIKVAEPRQWRPKHVTVWESVNGPVPKGHCLLFADRNHMNITIENLLLIRKGELSIMNKYNLIHNDAELTKAGLAIARLRLKLADMKKQQRRAT